MSVIETSDFIAGLALIVSIVALLKSLQSEHGNKLIEKSERIGRCMGQLSTMKTTMLSLARRYQSMANAAPSAEMADCLTRYASDCTRIALQVDDQIKNLTLIRSNRRSNLEQRLSLSAIEQSAIQLAQDTTALLSDAEDLEVDMLNFSSKASQA